MANERLTNLTGLSGATLSAAASKTSAAASAGVFTRNVSSTVVTVDVSDKPVVPSVVRNGVAVAAPAFNPAKVSDLIGRLGPIQRPTLPRVLSQSIQPGQRVTKGSSIDIVLVPVTNIKFDLLDNVHASLKDRSIADATVVTMNPAVRPLLNKAATADALTADERNQIVAALAPLNVAIDDSNPSTSFAAAFNSLKSAQAFE